MIFEAIRQSFSKWKCAPLSFLTCLISYSEYVANRFFYATDYEQKWVPEGMPTYSRPRAMISIPKVAIFWSPLGFPVIATLMSRIKFTAAYFCGDVIPKIIEGMSFHLTNSPRQLALYMDSTIPPRARELNTCLKKFRVRPIDHQSHPRTRRPLASICLGS
jgi:hypothetical protein